MALLIVLIALWLLVGFFAYCCFRYFEEAQSFSIFEFPHTTFLILFLCWAGPLMFIGVIVAYLNYRDDSNYKIHHPTKKNRFYLDKLVLKIIGKNKIEDKKPTSPF